MSTLTSTDRQILNLLYQQITVDREGRYVVFQHVPGHVREIDIHSAKDLASFALNELARETEGYEDGTEIAYAGAERWQAEKSELLDSLNSYLDFIKTEGTFYEPEFTEGDPEEALQTLMRNATGGCAMSRFEVASLRGELEHELRQIRTDMPLPEPELLAQVAASPPAGKPDCLLWFDLRASWHGETNLAAAVKASPYLTAVYHVYQDVEYGGRWLADTWHITPDGQCDFRQIGREKTSDEAMDIAEQSAVWDGYLVAD